MALQEHWEFSDAGAFDCDPSHLTNSIWSTGRYRNSNNYYRHRPRGERRQFETDGGLSIFTLHPIEKFEENEWDDIPRDGPFKTLHGSTFSRIKLNGTDIRVDVYNVHMLAQVADDCSPACRREELEELRAEILSYSRTSGNPVLVMGDFNIGGPPACTGNDSYRDIMQVLQNPRDLWLENHPSENGYTSDCLRNSTLSSVDPGCSSRDRIDFLFVVTSHALTNSKYEVVVREPNDIRLAEIRRPDGGGPCPTTSASRQRSKSASDKPRGSGSCAAFRTSAWTWRGARPRTPHRCSFSTATVRSPKAGRYATTGSCAVSRENA